MKFKFIKDFTNYKVSCDGSIISVKNNIILKPIDNGNGYLFVNLYNDTGHHHLYIHRIVAEHFIENPENLKYVDHIDRDKSNNCVENLRWVTAQENIRNTAHKPRYTVSKKGYTHHSLEVIERIKNDYRLGLKVSELSKLYKIPRQSISRFVKNLT